MKRVIEVEGMCCEKCAERLEKELLLMDGVTGAKASFARGRIFVETTLPDEPLIECVEAMGYIVTSVHERKGIFS